MRIATTAERLNQLMSERKLRQVDILDLAKPFCDTYKIKLTKSDLSQFVSGKVEPGQSKLTILGLALGVPESWLMGYDVPRVREKPAPLVNDDPELTDYLDELRNRPEKKMLFSVTKNATKEQIEALVKFFDAMNGG